MQEGMNEGNYYTADKGGVFKKRSPTLITRQRAYLDLCVRLVVLLSLLGVLFCPRPQRRRAYMPQIEVMDKSPDPCVAVCPNDEETPDGSFSPSHAHSYLFFQAVGTSKVALLFLTRGELYHEAAWRLWFRSAAGVLPVTAHPALCPPTHTLTPTPQQPSSETPPPPHEHQHEQVDVPTEEARGACGIEPPQSYDNDDDVIAQQHLFSVYVHLSADVDAFAMGPMWRTRLVNHRVLTEWGTHSLVIATRSLLWEAFKDPANQRFVLISESDIPLWDPLTTYYELMAEQRSRVNAWWHPNMDVDRWSWRMALSGARIRRSDWRKSAQWFSLLRSHVEVTLRDEVVFAAFEDHCRSAFDGDYGKWRECYSDEHYLPTLLHMKGLQEETVPSSLGVTTADWSGHDPHPHQYAAEEVTPELFIHRLRNNTDCPSVAAQHVGIQVQARSYFIRTSSTTGGDAGAQHLCSSDVDEHEVDEDAWVPHLPSGCSLLARKFPPTSSRAVLTVFRNCSSGLMLVDDEACAHASSHS